MQIRKQNYNKSTEINTTIQPQVQHTTRVAITIRVQRQTEVRYYKQEYIYNTRRNYNESTNTTEYKYKHDYTKTELHDTHNCTCINRNKNLIFNVVSAVYDDFCNDFYGGWYWIGLVTRVHG